MKHEILAFGVAGADDQGTAVPVCHVARLQRIISFIRTGAPVLHDPTFVGRVVASRVAPCAQPGNHKQPTAI